MIRNAEAHGGETGLSRRLCGARVETRRYVLFGMVSTVNIDSALLTEGSCALNWDCA